jgi:hypothetical protein
MKGTWLVGRTLSSHLKFLILAFADSTTHLIWNNDNIENTFFTSILSVRTLCGKRNATEVYRGITTLSFFCPLKKRYNIHLIVINLFSEQLTYTQRKLSSDITNINRKKEKTTSNHWKQNAFLTCFQPHMFSMHLSEMSKRTFWMEANQCSWLYWCIYLHCHWRSNWQWGFFSAANGGTTKIHHVWCLPIEAKFFLYTRIYGRWI